MSNNNLKEISRTAVVTHAEVGPYPKSLFDDMPKVKVKTEDHDWVELFEFYPDEIDFRVEELVGKTIQEILDLKTRKDIKYLQS